MAGTMIPTDPDPASGGDRRTPHHIRYEQQVDPGNVLDPALRSRLVERARQQHMRGVGRQRRRRGSR